MIVNAVEATPARLPILPGEWLRLAPDLCRGVEADYLLLDLGPAEEGRRYTVLGLRPDDRAVCPLAKLADIHASPIDGGLGIASSLFVPLSRADEQHRGHIAALYLAERRFEDADVERLRSVADRFLTFLGKD